MIKYIAESIGTFLLVAVVVGSGIMAENLSQGNDAIALLGNTIATGAILFVIIKMFASISGAHFNPIVSMVFLIRKEINLKEFIQYCLNDLSLKIIGLMCMPPIDEDPKKHFNLINQLAIQNELKYLSMGMSSDFERAVLNKSTFLRLGTLILGKRNII